MEKPIEATAAKARAYNPEGVTPMTINFPYNRIGAAALRDQLKAVKTDVQMMVLLGEAAFRLYETPTLQNWNIALANARKAARVEPKAARGLRVLEEAMQKAGYLGKVF